MNDDVILCHFLKNAMELNTFVLCIYLKFKP